MIQVNRASPISRRHVAAAAPSPNHKLELTFLGTRGGILKRSLRHRRHSALLACFGGARVMVDCGSDWRRHLSRLAPSAIVLTHAHPDHAGGLAGGAPCAVYATKATWRQIDRYPIARRCIVTVGKPVMIEALRFEAFAVEHSARAPAVGYRVTAGRTSIFYVPDVVAIRNGTEALRGILLYIGDGASLVRPIVRRRRGRRIGHTTIRAQIGWCAREGVANALFTHCGSAIVGGDRRQMDALLRQLGREYGVTARFAHDGLRLVLPRTASTQRMAASRLLSGRA